MNRISCAWRQYAETATANLWAVLWRTIAVCNACMNADIKAKQIASDTSNFSLFRSFFMGHSHIGEMKIDFFPCCIPCDFCMRMILPFWTMLCYGGVSCVLCFITVSGRWKSNIYVECDFLAAQCVATSYWQYDDVNRKIHLSQTQCALVFFFAPNFKRDFRTNSERRSTAGCNVFEWFICATRVC